ncbi:MAG: PfkB family carbohydrate kinase, partial [Planctomycetaceae bacterium]
MTTEAFDLIALGETMLSLVAADGDLAVATTFHATHGGAESNACAAFARRGLRAAWVSRLGADVAGDRVRAGLTSAGVDLSWARTDPTRPTGLMLRDRHGSVAYWRAGSAASALEPADLEGVPLETSRAVLVT